ncbi:MAG: hypothetical protein ACI9VR_000805 [Cognaticolwellia sp.]|jgi:hypothetical protein
MWGLQCSLRLWRAKREPRKPHVMDPHSPASQIHVHARQMFPDGVRIPQALPWEEALRQSAHAMSHSRVVFRPAIEFEELRIRPDLLLRLPKGGWRLGRVKASTKLRPIHLQELAIEHFVMTQAGIAPAQVGVLCINRRYRMDKDEPLLRFVDRTEKVAELSAALSAQLSPLRSIVLQEAPPIEPTGRRCRWPRLCPYLRDCQPEIPMDFPTGDSPQARLFRRAKENGSLCVLPGLQEKLEHNGATSYLDFEAIAPAIPTLPGLRPFTTLPVQFSVHHKQQDGTMSSHAYLHRDSTDPRPPLAAALLEALDGDNPIYVWGEFEGKVIGKLASACPTLEDPLRTLRKRIVDLQSLSRAYAYHPAFGGSWSIKRVLPALVPGQDYGDLSVNDGAQAVLVWTRMQHPDTPPDQAQVLAEQLLAYCGMDTLALVHIRDALLHRARLGAETWE